MMQWLLNVLRGIDFWEIRVLRYLEKLELHQLRKAEALLAKEVAQLNYTCDARISAHDKQALVDRQKLLAQIKIDQIKLRHELVDKQHEISVLEQKLKLPSDERLYRQTKVF